MENHEHHHTFQEQELSLEEQEINSWKRKLVWAWIFTIPLAFLMFSGRIFGIELFDEKIMTIIILILGFPVIFVFGFDTIKSGLREEFLIRLMS